MSAMQVRAAAYFRFYAGLNDHLKVDDRYRTVERLLLVPTAVKDIIESFGVPHPEVSAIVANDEFVDFRYVVRRGDRIAVYPPFQSQWLRPGLILRPDLHREEPRFVLDVHLGKLAAYLRMLGMDTLYQSCFSDPELVRISTEERRVLLTRDRGLLKHGAVDHGYWLRETDSRRQAAEVIERFDLSGWIRPFSRCMACNDMLEAVEKESIERELPARVAQLHTEFQRCRRCGRVYWKGSHYDRMLAWIKQLTAPPASP
jgi:hypothetical protein